MLQKKAAEKLPSFFANQCFYTKKLIEQSTSESVALFKSEIIKGDSLLVLAGGLGVDEWAFSYRFKSVISVEIDEQINDLVNNNFKLLQVSNVHRVSADANDFVNQSTTFFDVIYTDPDRRNEGKREILLSEHQPNIINLLPQIKKITNHLYIKCSPMYDHQMAINELSDIQSIYFISLKGEMKEMLIHLNFNRTISNSTIELVCVDIEATQNKMISFEMSENYPLPEICQTLNGYFYELGSSLVKARLNHHYAHTINLLAIDYAVPFYVSNQYNASFIGRVFKIEKVMKLNQDFKQYLKSKKITKSNVKSRGIEIKTEEIYKKYGLKEGGEDYFFICPHLGNKVVIHCIKERAN